MIPLKLNDAYINYLEIKNSIQSKMTDYSFMKSGFNNLTEDNTDYIQNLSSIMVAFTENAMKTASKYVNIVNVVT